MAEGVVAEIGNPEVPSPTWLNAIRVIWNPLLLQKITKHLPAETLLHLRGTCTGWNETFLPQLQKKHSPIELISESGGSCNAWESLTGYSQAMQDSKQIPFTKYKIIWLDEATDKELVDFFSICGPTITCLEFDSDPKDWPVTKILYHWTPELLHLRHPLMKLPKLKRLRFHTQPPVVRDLENLGHLHEILEQAVPLQNFEFIQSDGNQLGGAGGGCSTMELKTLAGTQGALEVFRILSGITSTDCPRLDRFVAYATLNSSQLEQNAVFFHLFNNFLMAQAGTLRHLEISVFFLPSPDWPQDLHKHKVQIPKMKNLNSFSLRQNGINSILQFEEQTLDATFPALKRFKYDGWVGGGGIALAHLAQLRHSGVTELVCDSCLNLSSARTWFPGVTRLELSVAEAHLDVLTTWFWQRWAKLECLHIRYDAYVVNEQLDLDRMLTGVQDKTKFEKLKQEFARLKADGINLEALRKLWRRYQAHFGIGDQKYLKKFILEVRDGQRLAFSTLEDIWASSLLHNRFNLISKSAEEEPALILWFLGNVWNSSGQLWVHLQ